MEGFVFGKKKIDPQVQFENDLQYCKNPREIKELLLKYNFLFPEEILERIALEEWKKLEERRKVIESKIII